MQSEIIIRIRQLKDLYLSPEINPLSSYPLEQMGKSGLEYIQECIRLLKRKEDPKIKIKCPLNELSSDTSSNISLIIKNHAERKLKLNHYKIKSLYRTGFGLLLRGLFIFALLMGIAQLFASGLLQINHTFFKNTLVTGLEVFAWVILWHPFEAFVYEPSVVREESKLIKKLKHAYIEVISE